MAGASFQIIFARILALAPEVRRLLPRSRGDSQFFQSQLQRRTFETEVRHGPTGSRNNPPGLFESSENLLAFDIFEDIANRLRLAMDCWSGDWSYRYYNRAASQVGKRKARKNSTDHLVGRLPQLDVRINGSDA